MADATQSEFELELQSTTPTGYPVRRRLTSAEAAFSISKKMDDDDDVAARARATLQGMIDGNPPYDQKELDELGLADMVNVNFLTLRANLDARVAAAHELFVEVPTLIEAKPISSAYPEPDMFHFCQVVMEEFTQLLHDWPQFLPSMDLVVRESDAYGIGFLLWPDEYDWRPKAFKRGNLRLDPKASVEVDQNDVYVCRGEYTAGQLYDLIEDEEAARIRGWKVGNVRDLLVRTFIEGAADDEDKFQRSTWESLQQMVRNNDARFQERQFDRVQVRHLLVREVAAPRKVSHYIIPEDDSVQVFLCEALDVFDDMHQAIWWLPYNYGDGYAKSVRGVASLMAQHDDLSNRFLGRVFDAGFLGAGLLLQPQTAGDMSRLQFIQHGPYTILPPELKATQSTFQPQIQPLLALRQVSENVMKNNTGTYRQHSEGIENETQKTARQVVEEVSKEARYEKAAIAHRYNHLDLLYRELLRRLLRKDYVDGDGPYAGKEEAKKFCERCAARGVPKKFLYGWKEHMRVDATRAIGLGSLGVRYDITNQLMSARGDMDEIGRRNAMRDWLAARVGYRNSDKYATAIDRDKVPTDAQSFATLENNDMAEGVPVMVGVDQLHKLHLLVHLPIIQQIMQAEAQAQIADPQKATLVLQLQIDHCGQHLQMLARDQTRAPFVKEVGGLLQAAQGTLRGLAAAVKRVQAQQQQAAEAQQETVKNAEQVLRDRELEAKVLEIQQKYRLKQMEQDSLNDMRRTKTEEQLAIRRESEGARMQLAAEKQAEELRQKGLTAEAERQLMAARG